MTPLPPLPEAAPLAPEKADNPRNLDWRNVWRLLRWVRLAVFLALVLLLSRVIPTLIRQEQAERAAINELLAPDAPSSDVQGPAAR